MITDQLVIGLWLGSSALSKYRGRVEIGKVYLPSQQERKKTTVSGRGINNTTEQKGGQ